MKKFSLLSMGLLFLSALIAQNKIINKQTERLPDQLLLKNTAELSKATVAVCNTDTVKYTLENTANGSGGLSFLALVGNGQQIYGEGLGQWFNATQPIAVSGFQFHGRAKNPNTTSSVNVRLYSSKPDSTPNVQLASETIALNYAATSLPALVRTVTFAAPVTVTGPYLVVVEAPANSTDTFQLVINQNGDGFQEQLSKVRFGGTQWADLLADSLDVDVLAYPIVKYNISATFGVGGNLTPGGQVNFTNTSSPIISDMFYNQAAYYQEFDFSYNWNLGEGGAAFGKAVDTSHIYAAVGNYNVVLRDTLFGWTMNCATDTTAIVRISNVVPVKLVSYDARKKESRVIITWEADNELGSDYYEVERSLDGITFVPIAKAKSNGNSHGLQSYTVYDASPQTLNYYRLVQYDKDGRKTYYGIRLVNFKDNKAALQVYPNPASDLVNLLVNASAKDRVTILVTDFVGKVVLQKIAAVITGDNNIKLNVSKLRAGGYIIKVISDTGSETSVSKFVKQ